MFLVALFGNLFAGGGSSCKGTLAGRTSNREKHLEKLFKIFVLSILVTGPGDLLVT